MLIAIVYTINAADIDTHVQVQYKSFAAASTLPALSCTESSADTVAPPPPAPVDDEAAAGILALMFASPSPGTSPHKSTVTSSPDVGKIYVATVGDTRKRKRRCSRESTAEVVRSLSTASNKIVTLEEIQTKLSLSADDNVSVVFIIGILNELKLVTYVDNSTIIWNGSSDLVDSLNSFKPTSSTAIDHFLKVNNLIDNESMLHQLLCLILEDTDSPLNISSATESMYGLDTQSPDIEDVSVIVHILESLGLVEVEGELCFWKPGKRVSTKRASLDEAYGHTTSSRGRGNSRVSAALVDTYEESAGHRASCHRCGNMRKKIIKCKACPQIYCRVCADLMVEEHGEDIFEGGCPKCKELCCCGKNKSASCNHVYHCYRKCPATKTGASATTSRVSSDHKAYRGSSKTDDAEVPVRTSSRPRRRSSTLDSDELLDDGAVSAPHEDTPNTKFLQSNDVLDQLVL